MYGYNGEEKHTDVTLYSKLLKLQNHSQYLEKKEEEEEEKYTKI